MKYLDRSLDFCLALTVIAPSVAIFLQVVYRYVLNDPSSWLDEFAVLAFAWMTMVGAAVSQRTDSHLSIEFFVKWLPARGQALVYALRLVAIAAVLGVLFWQGLQLTRQMSFIEYPAMEISRGFLFAILPVCAPFMLLYLFTSGIPRLRAAWSGKRIFGEAPQA
ncbi:MAG: TRAP transporter small permease [Betaproteobacteria bacterium]|nr:TRAP transporter small permease [Betaproteobacteria bacterium]